jgi:hypothetical protein
MFGLRQTVIDALVHLLRQRPDRFDRDHGVSTRLTGGTVLPLEGGIGDPTSLENGHGYKPTDALVMRNILRFIESQFSVSELSFVDLGCGRGRALLMASELPFREVIGVELDPAHCVVARQNVEAYRVKPARPWSRRNGAARAPVRVLLRRRDQVRVSGDGSVGVHVQPVPWVGVSYRARSPRELYARAAAQRARGAEQSDDGEHAARASGVRAQLRVSGHHVG